MRWKTPAAATLTILLAGCSAKEPPQTQPPVPVEEPAPVEEPVVEEPPFERIDELLEQAGTRYRVAINPAFNDESMRNRMRHQANDLVREAIDLCDGHPDCVSKPVRLLDQLSSIKLARPIPIVEEDPPVGFTDVPDDTPTLRYDNGMELFDRPEVFREEAAKWLTTQRTKFLKGLLYYEFFKEEFEEVYEQENLIVAIGWAQTLQESAWRIDMESYADAHGFFQFLPGTGESYGLMDERDLHDFSKSLRAKTRYLKDSLEKFNNDYLKAIASYIAGQNADALENNLDYWQIENRLGPKSRGYVRSILGAAYLFIEAHENPEKYNLDVPRVDGSLTQVELPMDASISEVRACLGNTPWAESWIQVLQNVNPDHWDTYRQVLPAGTEILIPSMTIDSFRDHCTPESELMNLLIEARPKEEVYYVRSGESLASIASRTSCGWRQIWNYTKERGTNIRDPNRLSIGDTIRIPVACIQ